MKGTGVKVSVGPAAGSLVGDGVLDGTFVYVGCGVFVGSGV
jgi:hypothetical protein